MPTNYQSQQFRGAAMNWLIREVQPHLGTMPTSAEWAEVWWPREEWRSGLLLIETAWGYFETDSEYWDSSRLVENLHQTNLTQCLSASIADDLAERSAVRERRENEGRRKDFSGSFPKREMLNFKVVLSFCGEEQPREKAKKAQAVSGDRRA